MTFRSIAAVLMAAAAVAASAAEPRLDYRIERWGPPGVSSDRWESHPALDPRTGDLWFVRSDKTFSGWRLMVSRCTRGGWAPAQSAPIAGKGLEADPYFTSDGSALYFISTRATGASASTALDIWRAVRDAQGRWSEPQRLPEPVNSNQAEWFPRPAPDGWLYFGSRRAGGFGKDDIWRARPGPDGRWRVENAGPEINSAGAEYEFQPSADGRWALLATDSGIYRVEHGPNGWKGRRRLGPAVNATGNEIGPMLGPDGQSFAFSRDAGDGLSGELYVAYAKVMPAWTRTCGVRRDGGR